MYIASFIQNELRMQLPNMILAPISALDGNRGVQWRSRQAPAIVRVCILTPTLGTSYPGSHSILPKSIIFNSVNSHSLAPGKQENFHYRLIEYLATLTVIKTCTPAISQNSLNCQAYQVLLCIAHLLPIAKADNVTTRVQTQMCNRVI